MHQLCQYAFPLMRRTTPSHLHPDTPPCVKLSPIRELWTEHMYKEAGKTFSSLLLMVHFTCYLTQQRLWQRQRTDSNSRKGNRRKTETVRGVRWTTESGADTLSKLLSGIMRIWKVCRDKICASCRSNKKNKKQNGRKSGHCLFALQARF